VTGAAELISKAALLGGQGGKSCGPKSAVVTPLKICVIAGFWQFVTQSY